MAAVSPGFSAPWGARSAHAHSPGPGFSLVAASLAHLKLVRMTLPPSVLAVLNGPRHRSADAPWSAACTFVTSTMPAHSTEAPAIANHLNVIIAQPSL